MKKPEESDKISENNDSASTDRLEAVRELLFGQNVQEYRGEIKELKDLIKSHRSELDKESDNLEKDITKRLESLETKLISRIDALNNKINEKISSLEEAKVSKKDLANLLTNLASKLNS